MAQATKPRNPVKLYIAHQDLKERYQNKKKGLERLKAYVKSVAEARGLVITVDRKENGTVEFELDGGSGQNREAEAKSDIQGEACPPNATKNYDQPPRYLPLSSIKQKSVSREASRVKSIDEQRRLQQETKKATTRAAKKPSTLTVEALEKHDRMTDPGPCSLRQFACDVCHHSWWRLVLKRKPVSRCKGVACGKKRYNALPRNREFGIGRCLCPNEACKREFFVYCEASERFACRKCKTRGCQPYVHPKWRKKAEKKRLNPQARDFVPRSHSNSRHASSGPHFEPISNLEHISASPPNFAPPKNFEPPPNFATPKNFEPPPNFAYAKEESLSESFASLSTADDTSSQGERRGKRRQKKGVKRRIFNASQPHTSTNSTISTFLSQRDCEKEEVELDYGSDEEDEERVGVCKFECDCGNKYTVKLRMVDQAECYHCHQEYNNPLRWAPPRDIKKHSNAKHSCSRCKGKGSCPNLTL